MVTIPTVSLNDGTAFPELGFGTYTLRGDDGVAAIEAAIGAGYRLLDSAVNYQNEVEVGEAVRRSGIRDELIVTTKVPGREHGYEETVRSAHGSLERLGLDRIDLYLIHWPNPSVDRYVETFRAMIDLRRDGKVGSIGVSNFTAAMLTRLIDETGVTPAVNQVEMHPLLTQKRLFAFCRKEGIQLESWRPLMQGRLDHPLIVQLAGKYGKTPAQILIRWHLQLGVVTIPKSSRAERIRENADVFDFVLEPEDVVAIDGLNENRRFGKDPDHVDF